MNDLAIKVTPLDDSVLISPAKALLPAGRYLIGDICYTAGTLDDAWDRWVDLAAEASNDFVDPVAGAKYNDWPLVAVSTLYGDGTYEDNKGRAYSVDAGSIGATPEALIDALGLSEEELAHAGHWETFENDFEVTGSTAGLIRIGHIEIPTGE